jgi:alpha-N-arabinofuranosidase
MLLKTHGFRYIVHKHKDMLRVAVHPRPIFLAGAARSASVQQFGPAGKQPKVNRRLSVWNPQRPHSVAWTRTRRLTTSTIPALVVCTLFTFVKPVSAQTAADVSVDTRTILHAVDPGIFGQFIEHYGRVIEHGLWAELLQNRKFYPFEAVGQMNVAAPWTADPDAKDVSYAIDHLVSVDGVSSQRLVLSGRATTWRGIRQSGFEVLGEKEYAGHAWIKADPASQSVTFALESPEGAALARSEASLKTADWHRYDFKLTPAPGLHAAVFRIAFNQPGVIWIGSVSLMPADNIDGLRRDVVELARTTAPPVLRWPGGGFADTYDWRKAIGPRDQRPPQSVGIYANRLGYDSQVDPDDFGTEEFMQFCKLIGARPYLTVNFGSATPDLARDWVEYCNGPAESKWGARRAENGHREPYQVKDWGVGNESWLSIEPGHSTPEGYGVYFNQFASAMRRADPSIRIVAVGDTLESSGNWDETVARLASPQADLLSVHYYYALGFMSQFYGDHPAEFYRSVVAAPMDVEHLLQQTIAAVDRATGDKKRMQIAFDEWNEADYGLAPPATPKDFSLNRLIEMIVSYGGDFNQPLRDGLFAARMLHVFMRAGDRIPIGCRTHMVNSTGVIRTSSTDAYMTASGAIMQLYAKHSGSKLLKLEQNSPTFEVPERGWKSVPYLDAAAAVSEDGRKLFIHLLNLEEAQPTRVQIHVAGHAVESDGDEWQVASKDFLDRNDFGVTPVSVQHHQLTGLGGEFTRELPPHSATILELALR